MICDNCGEEIPEGHDFYVNRVEMFPGEEPFKSRVLTPMTLCVECLIAMNDGLRRRSR